MSMHQPSYTVPRSHKDIVGRYRAMTAGGIEFSVVVVKPIENTTQEMSAILQKERIKAAAEAFRRGEGIGNGTKLPISVKAKDTLSITLNFNFGSKSYNIPIQAVADGSYVGNGRRFENLRKLTDGIMEQFELERGVAIHAAAQNSPAAYGMRR